jgi:ribosomal protein S18 acetylase RimI-like enzyme
MGNRPGHRMVPVTDEPLAPGDQALLLRPAVAADAPGIAELYRASFSAALPDIRLVHTPEQVRQWVRSTLVEEGDSWVAELNGELDGLAGFMTLTEGHLEQLYVAVGRWRQGIGTALLDLAKARSRGPLELYTFQANRPAVAFYLAHGFAIVEAGDGSGNEEGAPDYLLRWTP